MEHPAFLITPVVYIVINVEIILVAHFILEWSLKKKLPLLNNLNDHMKFHREIILLSSRYNKS